MTKELTTDEEDAIIVALTDYLDGGLSREARIEIEQRLAADEHWKRIHGELVETHKAKDQISGILKARIEPAPANFTNDLTDTIHKRSAGRFFGRRTFGDRVPFEALLVIAVLGLAVIGFLLWSSQTGSLKVDQKNNNAPKTEPIAPKP